MADYAKAKPTRLRHTGEWGATVQDETAQVGQTVCIVTRSGENWLATIDEVFWRGRGVAIVATTRLEEDDPQQCQRCRGPLRAAADGWPASDRLCGTCDLCEMDM